MLLDSNLMSVLTNSLSQIKKENILKVLLSTYTVQINVSIFLFFIVCLY